MRRGGQGVHLVEGGWGQLTAEKRGADWPTSTSLSAGEREPLEASARVLWIDISSGSRVTNASSSSNIFCLGERDWSTGDESSSLSSPSEPPIEDDPLEGVR